MPVIEHCIALRSATPAPFDDEHTHIPEATLP